MHPTEMRISTHLSECAEPNQGGMRARLAKVVPNPAKALCLVFHQFHLGQGGMMYGIQQRTGKEITEKASATEAETSYTSMTVRFHLPKEPHLSACSSALRLSR